MRLPPRLTPRSITAQITVIVAVSVLLGVVLVVTSLHVFFDRNSSDLVARIADLTLLVNAAESPDDAAASVGAARRAGMKVTRVAPTDLETLTDDGQLPFLAKLVAGQLESNLGLDVIGGARIGADGADQLAVRVGDNTALLFDASAVTNPWHLVLAPTVLTLTIVLVFVMFLPVYAVRWIIAPLSSVAAAAHSFGRYPDDNRVLSHSGPREIVPVAEALNDMRTRIPALLDDRARMLAAISHDLRTPLTRLRLRAERIADPDPSNAMLRGITRVTHMLDETLDYLRGMSDRRARPASIFRASCRRSAQSSPMSATPAHHAG